MISLDALQAWLAVEHEAVWLYGVIGGRIDSLSDAARKAWNEHRDNRDRLTDIIQAAQAEPVGPSMGYGAIKIDSVSAARSAAQGVENRVESACIGAMDDRNNRSFAVRCLRSAAVRGIDWGAGPDAFPGLE